MDGNVRIDRDILIAVSIGAISVIGICLVLLIGLRPQPTPAAASEPTVTPFKYLLVATETHTAEPEFATEAPVVPLDDQGDNPTTIITQSLATPGIGTPSETSVATDGTASAGTQVVDEGQMLTVGKYDDTDMRITYYGDWTTEFFVDGAFEESLYVSTLAGNTVTFSFMGRQLVLGYLGSSDFELGMVTVAIDGSPHQMDQSSGDNWTSPQLIFDEHFVVLTHQTGDVIYLDYIEIR